MAGSIPLRKVVSPRKLTMAEFIHLGESESGSHLSRREFVKAVGTAALAASVPVIVQQGARAASGPSPSASAETAVARFYKTITDSQRKLICFPFDHPLRSEVKNNWAIVKPTIGQMSKEQQALCQEVFKNL